ncbi:MAG: universal stress protein [Deltaproteobacteria bacterium]|nr:universal stress protein [Deltaproteobacteria bacterium]MBW2138190.1 universal stress protein [Deltaproteobacteria bacterium]
MSKKILLAMDDSDNAMRAVEYIAASFKPEYDVTIFGVIPDTAAVCDMNSPELTPFFLSQQGIFCTMEDKKRELVRDAAEKGKAVLMDSGFDEKRITIKIESRKKSIARDIIEEARSGSYDTVVMGRRGLSSLEEIFLGSVSQKVLHASKGLTVILVT